MTMFINVHWEKTKRKNGEKKTFARNKFGKSENLFVDENFGKFGKLKVS